MLWKVYIILETIILTDVYNVIYIAVVLRLGLVTEILYGVNIDNGGICYGNFNFFCKHRMSCSCIGMEFVTVLLYVLIRILEVIWYIVYVSIIHIFSIYNIILLQLLFSNRSNFL